MCVFVNVRRNHDRDWKYLFSCILCLFFQRGGVETFFSYLTRIIGDVKFEKRKEAINELFFFFGFNLNEWALIHAFD